MFIIDECLIEFYATESTFDEGCRHDKESRASRCDVVDATLFNQNNTNYIIVHARARRARDGGYVCLCARGANAPSRLAPEPGPGIHAFDGFQVFIHVPLGATRGASGANERFALRCERG